MNTDGVHVPARQCRLLGMCRIRLSRHPCALVVLDQDPFVALPSPGLPVNLDKTVQNGVTKEGKKFVHEGK